ncbi:acyltransferase [Enterobacter mori]|uniref:acyltransferase family protein n=1 Tax=Enterobacter mori TaxID=539813 RepID=UPI0032AFD482
MNKLYSIQILRGLAAVAVVIDHVTHYMHKSFSGESWLFSSNIYNVGGLGVDLFFCISGFIMVITTYNKPNGFSQSVSFLKKRFVRIYPTYWFYCILTLALPFILYGKTDLISKYDSLFLLQSFLLLPAKIAENSFSPFLGQGWTLQYELYFYIAFALALLVCRGWKVIVLCSSMIIALLVISKHTVFNEYINYLVSNTIVIDFIMGMIAANIYISLSCKGVSIPPIIGCIALFVTVLLISFNVIYKSPIDRVILFGIPSFFIVTLFSLVSIDHEKLINKFLVQLGEASYTIYLAHMIFIWTAMKYTQSIGWINADLAIVAIVSIICLISYIMYMVIERNLTLTFNKKKNINHAESIKEN